MLINLQKTSWFKTPRFFNFIIKYAIVKRLSDSRRHGELWLAPRLFRVRTFLRCRIWSSQRSLLFANARLTYWQIDAVLICTRARAMLAGLSFWGSRAPPVVLLARGTLCHAFGHLIDAHDCSSLSSIWASILPRCTYGQLRSSAQYVHAAGVALLNHGPYAGGKLLDGRLRAFDCCSMPGRCRYPYWERERRAKRGKPFNSATVACSCLNYCANRKEAEAA